MSKFVTLVRNSILLATAVAAATPALADTFDAAPTIAVSYADLDLSSAKGQSRLHHRLDNAAQAVCEDQRMPASRIQSAYNTCVARAMTKADAQFAMLTTKSEPKVAIR